MNKSLREDWHRQTARIAELEALLCEVEWVTSVGAYDLPGCPICLGTEPGWGVTEQGHLDDCRLAKALGEK